MRTYANITNGLAFQHDDVCCFQSCHGHNAGMGYLRLDSMPYSAVIDLLTGDSITVIDAVRSGKALSDGIRYGLTTWCIIFNRALRVYVRVAPWETREMRRAAYYGPSSKAIVQRIRRLQEVYGHVGPVTIGDNCAIRIICHQHFESDDKPRSIIAARRTRVGC